LVPGALSSGVNWSGHEADHKASSTVEVKNERSHTSTPLPGLHGRHKANFIFTLDAESLHSVTVTRSERLAGQFAGQFYTIITRQNTFKRHKTHCSEKIHLLENTLLRNL
jgi:hypothetical protein